MCVDRAGKPTAPHAARVRAAGAQPYDSEVESIIAALPGFARHEIYAAVVTIRWARTQMERNPEPYQGLAKPSLSPKAVAAKVQELYRGETVLP